MTTAPTYFDTLQGDTAQWTRKLARNVKTISDRPNRLITRSRTQADLISRSETRNPCPGSLERCCSKTGETGIRGTAPTYFDESRDNPRQSVITTKKGLASAQPQAIDSSCLRLFGINRWFAYRLPQRFYDLIRAKQQLMLPIQCRSSIYRRQDAILHSPMYSHAANIVPLHYFSNAPKFSITLHLRYLLTSSRRIRQEVLCYICANDTTKLLILVPYHVTIVTVIHTVHSYKGDNGMEHHIYTLSDPRDGSIRYVGMSQNAFRRYGAHLTGTGTEGEEKMAWIEDLLNNEILPVLKIIDRVDGREAAFAKETYWIKRLTQDGAILLNKACIVRRESADIKAHREAIERRAAWLEKARGASEKDEACVGLFHIGDVVFHKGIPERNREKWTVLETESDRVYVHIPRTSKQQWYGASCLAHFE